MPQDYTLTADAVRTLQKMAAWWRRQPRSVTGGGAPRFPPVPFQFKRYELKDSLTPGGSAEAYILKWDGYSDYVRLQVNSEYVTIIVYDTIGDKRAIGRDDVAEGESGAQGWAIHPHDVDRWEIYEIQQQSRMMWGTTTSIVGTTDATFTVSGLTAIDGGMTSVADTTGSTWTIQNSPDKFSIAASVQGKILLDISDGELHPFDYACCEDCECECST